MLEEIKNRYQTFGDAGIDKIEYQTYENQLNPSLLVVYMTCLNWETQKWEKVKFKFIDVSSFRFIETNQLQSSIVFEALLMDFDSKIIIDFYPIQVDGLGKLKADPDSSFQVQSSKVTYEVIG